MVDQSDQNDLTPEEVSEYLAQALSDESINRLYERANETTRRYFEAKKQEIIRNRPKNG